MIDAFLGVALGTLYGVLIPWLTYPLFDDSVWPGLGWMTLRLTALAVAVIPIVWAVG